MHVMYLWVHSPSPHDALHCTSFTFSLVGDRHRCRYYQQLGFLPVDYVKYKIAFAYLHHAHMIVSHYVFYFVGFGHILHTHTRVDTVPEEIQVNSF